MHPPSDFESFRQSVVDAVERGDANSVRSVIHPKARTIAVVGLSTNWHRPSYFAAKYMQDHGYRIIPVNPTYPEVLGRPSVATLADIGERVDIVDCFRKASEMEQIAREAVAP